MALTSNASITGVSGFHIGDIAELILFTTAPTPTQRAALTQNQGDYFGITIT